MSSEKSVVGLPVWFVDGYRSFLSGDFRENKANDERLAEEGQNPKALWIGCSDSRVIPERILGAAAGDIFVVRNVANLVPPINTDSTSSGAAIEFAMGALNVDDIFICGHEDCGGMKALLEGVDSSKMPYLSKWISYSRAGGEDISNCDCSATIDLEKLIKENVTQQIAHLRTYPSVIDAKETRGLRIHALYYKLRDGVLEAYDRESEKWCIV